MQNKDALKRYKLINLLLINKYKSYPTMDRIIEFCQEKLGVELHVSTIQKDIKAMKEDEGLGYFAPIKFHRGHLGYYYTDPNYSIDNIALQEKDIESIKASIDLLSAYTGSRVSENFAHALNKVLASVKESFPEENSKRKIIQTDHAPQHIGFEHFETLLHAAKEKIPICFVHYSYSNRDFKSVIVHPIMLKEFNNSWYLLGYSENHKSLRTFGFDRIYEPKLLKLAYKETDEKITTNYFKHIYGVYPIKNQKLQEIRFWVDPTLADYINAHPIHESQIKEHEMSHGHTIFKVKLIPSQELINLFQSYGEQLIVLSPIWIQDKINTQRLKALQHEKRFRHRFFNK
jgi:predicted DNA-binding transcriptional regulator YafY